MWDIPAFCESVSIIATHHPRAQMVLIDAFDGELICEYPVQEQGECPEYDRLCSLIRINMGCMVEFNLVE